MPGGPRLTAVPADCRRTPPQGWPPALGTLPCVPSKHLHPVSRRLCWGCYLYFIYFSCLHIFPSFLLGLTAVLQTTPSTLSKAKQNERLVVSSRPHDWKAPLSAGLCSVALLFHDVRSVPTSAAASAPSRARAACRAPRCPPRPTPRQLPHTVSPQPGRDAGHRGRSAQT